MTQEDVYLKSIDKWSKSRGIGTISYDQSLNLFEPIKMVLNKYFAHNPDRDVIVVVSYNSRIDEWAGKLIQGFKFPDKIGTRLKFYTIDSIIVNGIKDDVELLILDQVEKYVTPNYVNIFKKKYINFKFLLGVTNTPYPDGDGFVLSEFCPVIDRITKVDVVTHGILDKTVEYNIPTNMNNLDYNKYKDYNEYIKDTIDMFGSFDMIMKCYHGDTSIGVSADYYRNELAREKGWSTDIDTSNDYFASIDRYYNPNSIYERAKTFNEIIKKRQNLLSDNTAKLLKITDIIKANPEAKILIINKRFTYAKVVCDFINNNVTGLNLKKDLIEGTLFKPAEKMSGVGIASDLVCVEYHPNVDSRPLIDSKTGDFVRYKSGDNKGKVKNFGATSLNKIANQRFNEGYHNVVSSISSIPKEGEFEIDAIIITSPECNTVNQLQYRVSKLKFKDSVKIINIYIKDTKEDTKLHENQALTTNKVIEINDVKDVIL